MDDLGWSSSCGSGFPPASRQHRVPRMHPSGPPRGRTCGGWITTRALQTNPKQPFRARPSARRSCMSLNDGAPVRHTTLIRLRSGHGSWLPSHPPGRVAWDPNQPDASARRAVGVSSYMPGPLARAMQRLVDLMTRAHLPPSRRYTKPCSHTAGPSPHLHGGHVNLLMKAPWLVGTYIIARLESHPPDTGTSGTGPTQPRCNQGSRYGFAYRTFTCSLDASPNVPQRSHTSSLLARRRSSLQ